MKQGVASRSRPQQCLATWAAQISQNATDVCQLLSRSDARPSLAMKEMTGRRAVYHWHAVMEKLGQGPHAELLVHVQHECGLTDLRGELVGRFLRSIARAGPFTGTS